MMSPWKEALIRALEASWRQGMAPVALPVGYCGAAFVVMLWSGVPWYEAAGVAAVALIVIIGTRFMAFWLAGGR